MRLALLAVLLLAFPITASAQPWATNWAALSEDGETPLTGDRVAHAAEFVGMLNEASVWFASMGLRAPDMERVPSNPAAYLARVKTDPEDIVSSTTYFPNTSPASRMNLTGDLDMTNPTSAIERLMWGSPVHELFHAVTWRYSGYAEAALPLARSGVRLDRCPEGTDATLLGWFNEGASSVLQIRWYERERGGPYGHPFTHPGTAAWVRQFDSPLHAGRVPPHLQDKDSPAFAAEAEEGRSWRCGYGAWPFWYFVGDQLAKQPGQEVEFLRHILEQTSGWDGGALEAIDNGLRAAATAFGSSHRVDEGLVELYPAFIAEYADTTAFYERPVELDLRGRSEVKWHDGFIEPLAATAFEVSINIDVSQPANEPSRFRVTLDPQENREQLHLIEGQRVIQQPTDDVDPYQFEVPVYGDTTILVRLANVAEMAVETEGTNYAARFELGGFYGAPASGPYVAPDVDIPPGFNVMSGPPELVSCQGGADGGSVFDLITAAEATGDVRRMVDGGERMLDNMGEVLDDGEFYFPGMTPAQREAMQRAVASGAISQAELAEMRAAVGEAQGQMDEVRQQGNEPQAELAREYQDRSRLLVTLVGQAGGETCQLIIAAGLRGEEGGAQHLTTEDTEDHDSDDPLPVGIADVGWMVGTVQDMAREENPFRVCMMTPREQARERQSSCPVLCSGGTLALEEASQGHAKGTLNVDLIRTTPSQSGCPNVQRAQLVVGFNITSANAGQDAEMFRGMSDETLRAMGMDQEMIDGLRRFDNGLLSE